MGVTPGEADADRILEAAMERKKRLDALALSEHCKLASELAGEVADAMSLLMKRAAQPRAPVAFRQATPAPIGAEAREGPVETGRAVTNLERVAVTLGAPAATGKNVVVPPILPRPEHLAELPRRRESLSMPASDASSQRGGSPPAWKKTADPVAAGEGKKILQHVLRLLAVVVLVFAVGFGAIFLMVHVRPRTSADSRPFDKKAAGLSSKSEETDFVRLFDGADLSQWEVEQGIKTWKVEGGAMVAGTQAGHTGKWLFSKEDYGDYTLRLEIRLSASAQCSFAFRADSQGPESNSPDAFLMVPKPPAEPGPRSAAAKRTRAAAPLDGIFAGRDVGTKTMPTVPVSLMPADAWNDVELKLQGPSLHVSINGQPIPLRSDIQSKRDRTTDHTAWRASLTGRELGRIGLRASQAGEVRLRNIRIKAVPNASVAVRPPVSPPVAKAPTPPGKAKVPPDDPTPQTSPSKTPTPPAANEPIGLVASTKHVLLRVKSSTGTWERLPDGAALFGNDRLLSLPAFRPRVVLGGVSLELADATELTCRAPVGKGPAGVDVRFGRIVARGEGAAGSSLRVTAGDHSGVCQFTDAESVVAIEVRRTQVASEDPEKQPAALAADLYAISGKVAWRDDHDSKEVQVLGPSRLNLSEQSREALPLPQRPVWVSGEAVLGLDQLAAAVLGPAVTPGRSAVLALRELADNRRREVRWLATRSLSLVEDYESLVGALDDVDQRVYWFDVIDQLRAAVFRGPESASGVRRAIEKRYGSQATVLYEMLWRHRPDSLQPEDALRLVELLGHDALPFRILSFWNLKNSYKVTLSYRPEDAAPRRQAAIQRWRERVKTIPASRSALPAAPKRIQIRLDLGAGVTMEFVLIPAGRFLMGSPESDQNARSDEKPQHLVRITRPFYLGKHEVTQAQWKAIMGTGPSRFSDSNHPVEDVSWHDCERFIRKLNDKLRGGWVFSLPTEAQWEYACRAGTTTKWSFGDEWSNLDGYAWYDGNSAERTHPVNQKAPNPWGLYDMHGNVWEWCVDWYGAKSYAVVRPDDPTGPDTGASRVLRGGSWGSSPIVARSAARFGVEPFRRDVKSGFRIARTQ